MPFADTWGMHDVGTGWWLLMMVGMIVFWGAVIWGIVWLLRSRPDGDRRESAREVLDRRLANGEISDDEYQQKRALLEPGDHTRPMAPSH